jgi:predicted dehydrogenase
LKSIIKIGFIGCGKQATKHLASLRNVPGVELVLSDIQKELAERVAEKNGVGWVQRSDDIYTDESIQAVIICTPTRSHVPLIRLALESGKDVFCEKPLSDSLKEATELKELVAESGRIVMLGYIYRYVPIFEEGFRLIHEQRVAGISLVLGKPLSAFFRLGGRGGHQVWKHQKENGGGAINEMLVHMVDLANWYFGPLKRPEVISCDLRSPDRLINGKLTRVDAEDYILVRCFGVNDIEILCQADLITPSFSQYVEIQSENGTFMGSIQPDMPSYVFLKESRGGFEAAKTELRFGRRNVVDIQMLVFVQSVLKGILPDRNTIEDSLNLMKIMDEIQTKAEE